MKTKIPRYLLALFFLALAGCGTKTLKIKDPYPKPNILGMKDDMWVLTTPLLVNYYNKNSPSETYSIEVPEGFVMDLASIPIGFRFLAGKYHDLDTAAIVHDYLFWLQPCKNEENGKRIADKLYRDTLKESEKESGESRFMPKEYFTKVSEEIAWSSMKADCCSKQVSQELVFSNENFCSIKSENR